MRQMLLAACLVGCACLTAVVAQEPAAVKKHQFPENPKAAVVTLDYKGGFTPPRTGNAPSLSILADGSVEIPANFQGQKSYSGKLTEAELHELLDFIIVKNKFFEYDQRGVQKKLQGGGPRIAVADAATTTLTVNADGKDKTVQHHALGFGGGKPVEEVQQLQAVQRKLEQLRSVIQLGGKAEVEKWLKMANEHLKQQQPAVPPLTFDDFQFGNERAAGSYIVGFSRIVPAASGNVEHQEVTSVTINQQPNMAPAVSVVFRPGKK